MKSAVSQSDQYENNEKRRGNQQEARPDLKFIESVGGKKKTVVHKQGSSISGVSEPQTPRKNQSPEVDQVQLKLSDS
jgi:hypothetical protein